MQLRAAGGEPFRVVVLGGGFGGLFTALKLAAGPGRRIEVVLVDRAERFVFKPLLYELLNDEVDEDEIAPRFTDILGAGPVRYVRAEARRVDLAAREVALAGGAGPEALSWDALVLALGVRPFFRGVPGVAQHALTAAGLDDFRRLRAHVDEVAARPGAGAADARGRRFRTICVVGAGASGVETTLKLADRLAHRRPRFRLVLVEAADRILPGFSAALRRTARLALRERGVELRLRTPVEEASAAGLTLRGATGVERVAAETLIWTAGTHAHELTRTLPGEHDAAGRILVPGTLELPGHEGVFVLGDMARLAVGREAPPATAQVAFQQAAAVARNVLGRRDGRPLVPFRYLPVAETLSLGKGEDVLKIGALTLEGPGARFARRLVYLARLPGQRHRAIVAARWAARTAWEVARAALGR